MDSGQITLGARRLIGREHQHQVEDVHFIGPWDLGVEVRPDPPEEWEECLFDKFNGDDYDQTEIYDEIYGLCDGLFTTTTTEVTSDKIETIVKDWFVPSVKNCDDDFYEHVVSQSGKMDGNVEPETLQEAAELWGLYIVERDP